MPFEDELGDALRRTGDTFQPFDRPGLVDGGVTRGRRRLARRRAAAVTGSVLALSVVGVAGGYATGTLGSDGSPAPVAAPAEPTAPSVAEKGAGKGTEEDTVTREQMIKTFKDLLPEGRTTRADGRGITQDPRGVPIGPYASAVFDDGKGAAAISLNVSVVDPAGQSAAQFVECPSQALVQHDACSTKTLSDGSRYMLFQGYEYPDRRVDTKVWRATVITAEGVMVDASEWNAPAEKDAEISRPTPPLTAAQMQSLVTDGAWRSIGAQLGKYREEAPEPDSEPGAAVDDVLTSLLPKDLKVVDRQGEPGYGFVVADDGKGASFIQVNAQRGMGDVMQGATGDVTTLPDGTKVMVRKEADPDQKGGEGTIGWTVDTVRPDGFRVVMMAFNAPGQGQDASRAEPVLTIEQMKTIALDAKWRSVTG